MNDDIDPTAPPAPESARKHTPAPWAVIEDSEEESRWLVCATGIPPAYVDATKWKGWIVAEIHNGMPGDSLDTELANARLIAAAPGLLAGIKNLLRVLDLGHCLPSDMHRSRAEIICREAIAKAEGTPS